MFSKIPRWAIEWAPALLFLVAAVLFVRTCAGGVEDKFDPISIVQFDLSPAGPYEPGERITLHNGVCNNSEVVLTADVHLWFQETRADPITAARFDVFAGPVSFDPGCIGMEPISGPLPPAITPSFWRLHLDLSVPDPSSQEVQELGARTPEFEVRK